MLKLANQVIDIHDDVTKEGMRKLAKTAPNIHVMSDSERARLSDTDFALTMITKTASKLNKFPIDTADNTWLSNEYFDMTHQRLPKTAAATAAHYISRACGEFNITPKPSVAGLAKEAVSNLYYEEEQAYHQAPQRTHASLDKFADIDNICDNYTAAQYVFSSPTHVKMAGVYFDKHAEKMPLHKRHKYAAAVQRRAHELGMGAQGGTIRKYASDHYSAQLDAHLSSRRSLIEFTNPEMVEPLSKLASMKQQLTPSEFAQVLHGFDKRAKLDRYYGGHLQDPYTATFADEPDQYAGYRYKKANVDLDSDQIRKLVVAKESKIKEYFGTSMAQELKKDPVPIFDSLPNDAKAIIAGFADGTL